MTIDELKKQVRYDPETGLFHWLNSKSGRNTHKPAGSLELNGYYSLMINAKKYKSHRLAWFYVYGYFPDVVDHVNGNKQDNRICNLRSSSTRANNENRRKSQKNNSLGILGVIKFRNKYRASICVKGKIMFLGDFDTPEKASSVYIQAKRKYHEGCTI